MAGEGDVFGRSRELHGHAELTDHLADTWAYQVHTQHFVGLGIGDDLGEAFGLVVDLGPAVGRERELADFIGTPFGLELLFGLAHGGQLRAGVDHARDKVVVDLVGLAGDAFDAGHRFVFGFVR
ncbi:hypothetical protein D3C75_1182770 [compost metagenome]